MTTAVANISPSAALPSGSCLRLLCPECFAGIGAISDHEDGFVPAQIVCVNCGHAAGCTTVLIEYGYDEELRVEPAFRVASLLDAARLIIDRAPVPNRPPSLP